MRQRLIPFIVLGLIVALVAEWNVRTGRVSLFSAMNDFWLEFCVGNAGDRIGDPAVTVVRIDDGYEPLRIGEDDPAAADGRLSRLDFATMLGFLGKLDPKAVAFLPTPTFDESLVLNQTDIVPLRDAAMQLPRFHVAANVSNDGEEASDAAALDYAAIRAEGDTSAVPPFTRTALRPDEQLLANADPVFKRVESARDLAAGPGAVQLVASYRGEIVPSILLAAVAGHAGVPLDEVVLDLESARPAIHVGELVSIPVARDGSFAVPVHAGVRRGMRKARLNEAGEAETAYLFTSLTVDELAYTGGEDDEVARRILSDLQGQFASVGENLVLLGYDRRADRRIELGSDTVSETMLLARAAATIQSGRFIEWWPFWGRWLAFLAVLAVAAVLFRLPRSKFVPLWLVAMLLYFGGVVMVFRTSLCWSPPFALFALFGLMLVIGLLVPGGNGKAGSDSKGEA